MIREIFLDQIGMQIGMFITTLHQFYVHRRAEINEMKPLCSQNTACCDFSYTYSLMKTCYIIYVLFFLIFKMLHFTSYFKINKPLNGTFIAQISCFRQIWFRRIRLAALKKSNCCWHRATVEIMGYNKKNLLQKQRM